MNAYKLLFSVLVMVLSVNISFAQCKFDTDKKDDFSEKQFRDVSVKIGGMLYHWELKMEQEGDKYRLGMQIKWGLHIANGIEEGHTFLLLKLENGDVVEVKADKFYAASHHGVQGSGQIVSIFYPMGEVDKSVIEKLSKYNIEALKCSFGGEEEQLKGIKNKQTKNVQEYAECLLK